MALVKCPDCGREVSDQAPSCPNCGRPMATRRAPPPSPSKKSSSWLSGCLILACLGFCGLYLLGHSAGDSRNASLAEDLSSASRSASAAPPPTGFRSYNWGAPPRAGLKKSMGPTDEGITMYVLSSKKSEPLFDFPVREEDYAFVHGKFYQGNAYLAGEPNLQKVKATLISKFGNPTFVNERLKLYQWKWPKDQIEMRLYQTTIMFANSAIE